MLERLLKLSEGVTHLKENVTLRLGMVGQFSTSREINAAWSETKKKAAKLHPDIILRVPSFRHHLQQE